MTRTIPKQAISAAFAAYVRTSGDIETVLKAAIEAALPFIELVAEMQTEVVNIVNVHAPAPVEIPEAFASGPLRYLGAARATNPDAFRASPTKVEKNMALRALARELPYVQSSSFASFIAPMGKGSPIACLTGEDHQDKAHAIVAAIRAAAADDPDFEEVNEDISHMSGVDERTGVPLDGRVAMRQGWKLTANPWRKEAGWESLYWIAQWEFENAECFGSHISSREFRLPPITRLDADRSSDVAA